MAEMKTERKSVLDYLSKNKFVIPLYQRAYVWGESECEELLDDIVNFFETREENDDYFLGSVVMYKENNLQNLIDGQQRTTTLSLLIRVLYTKALNHKSGDISELKRNLESCLWDKNGLSGEPDFSKMHLKSEVAIDSDNEILANILSENYEIPSHKLKSNYEKNYSYFVDKMDKFAQERPNEWLQFCLCLLNSCIILPIECDGQENALRIFNTLNNRGISLSTADIFKGLIYQNKSVEDRLKFAKEWKELEGKIADSSYLKKEGIDFLFTQYEHILRALHNEVDTVTPSTLEFFTKKDKANSKKKKVNFAANLELLKEDKTFYFIQELAEFWCEPKEYMSEEAQKWFDILNIYQNKVWQMVLSMCFYVDRPEKFGDVNKNYVTNIFDRILPQLTCYLAIALIYSKGGSVGIFWGLMKANVNLKDGKEKIFEKGLAIPNINMPKLEIFVDFSSIALSKQVRFILAIFALIYSKNQSWEWNDGRKNHCVINAELEHILPKKWQEANYNGLSEADAAMYLEQIGNKMLLEKKINIQAGNGYFVNKRELYKKSNFEEAKEIAYQNIDFSKEEIEKRNEKIYNTLNSFFKKTLF
ncbi:MAG: DUF262 domain-containing HNH endonuclease family protein [Helicobacter sp.]|nr:DUF262 domain-containing HNH endonuclease family protein [Helicobacter sp.]